MYARTGASPSPFAICGLPPESSTTFEPVVPVEPVEPFEPFEPFEPALIAVGFDVIAVDFDLVGLVVLDFVRGMSRAA